MADILLVEVGDKFSSTATSNTLEVTKIWCEFSLSDQRWETNVTHVMKQEAGDSYTITSKAREFIRKLKDGYYDRVYADNEISFSPTTTTTSQVSSGPLAGASLPKTPTTTQKYQQWEADFRRYATSYGLQPTDLGRKFWLNKTRQYTIIGAKPGNRKAPIMIRGKRGGIYKIAADLVKRNLV